MMAVPMVLITFFYMFQVDNVYSATADEYTVYFQRKEVESYCQRDTCQMITKPWMKHCNVSCSSGTELVCVNDANNDKVIYFCMPTNLECPEGKRGFFTTDNTGNVTKRVKDCLHGTYLESRSDCVYACKRKRTDFRQIPDYFVFYSNGSNKIPPQVYCNASAGMYSKTNKTFHNFDDEFTYTFSDLCLNISDRNPCTGGLAVLPNGSRVEQQQRDIYMLQLKWNTVDESGGNHEPIITIHPLTTTAEPMKTTTELSNNNLTTGGNSTHVKETFNKTAAIAGSVCGVLVVIVVILVAVYIRHRRNKIYSESCKRVLKLNTVNRRI